MRLGIGEILIVLVVVLLIFGANKIPQLGDALGKGIRNFKKATGAGDDAIDVTPPKDPERIAGAPAAPGAQGERQSATAETRKP